MTPTPNLTANHPNLASEDAERALLATALEDNAVITRVWDFLRAEHFTRSIHAKIYTYIDKAVSYGRGADIAEIKLMRELDGENVETAYLDALESSAVDPDMAEQCGKRIHELWLRREIVELTSSIADMALSSDASPWDVIGSAECYLYDIASCNQTDAGLQAFEGAVTMAISQAEAAFKRQGKPSGLMTGFTALDRKLGGLQPSELVILAGRYSMGATELASNIAVNAARACREGDKVAFFSLELSAEQLAARILAEQAGISSHKIRQGELDDREFESLIAAAEDKPHGSQARHQTGPPFRRVERKAAISTARKMVRRLPAILTGESFPSPTSFQSEVSPSDSCSAASLGEKAAFIRPYEMGVCGLSSPQGETCDVDVKSSGFFKPAGFGGGMSATFVVVEDSP